MECNTGWTGQKSNLDRSVCLQKLCYGFGHVYNDLCAAIWFSYMLFYFQIVLQMESTISGVLIMIGTICVTIGFSSIFSIKMNPSLWWYVVCLGASVILFQIGWAIVQISHLSGIPTLSKDYAYSSDLTAIRYTATVLSNITVYLLTWLILGYNEQSRNVGAEDFSKFKKLVLCITIIGLIATIIFYIGVDWNKNTENKLQDGSSKQNGKNAHFLRSFSIYLVSLMYMSSRLYTVLNLIYIPLYLEERSNGNTTEATIVRNSIAIVPLVSFCASFLASIFLNYKSKYVNDKAVYFIGTVCALCGSIWIAIGIPLGSYELIYAVGCLIGIGSSATMVSSLCLTAQFVKINSCRGGSVYSAVTFTDKLISGGVVFLIQYLQCSPKEGCPNYYEHLLSYACGVTAIIGMASLITLHYQEHQQAVLPEN